MEFHSCVHLHLHPLRSIYIHPPTRCCPSWKIYRFPSLHGLLSVGARDLGRGRRRRRRKGHRFMEYNKCMLCKFHMFANMKLHVFYNGSSMLKKIKKKLFVPKHRSMMLAYKCPMFHHVTPFKLSMDVFHPPIHNYIHLFHSPILLGSISFPFRALRAYHCSTNRY